jgi:hypothetical protein
VDAAIRITYHVVGNFGTYYTKSDFCCSISLLLYVTHQGRSDRQDKNNVLLPTVPYNENETSEAFCLRLLPMMIVLFLPSVSFFLAQRLAGW